MNSMPSSTHAGLTSPSLTPNAEQTPIEVPSSTPSPTKNKRTRPTNSTVSYKNDRAVTIESSMKRIKLSSPGVSVGTPSPEAASGEENSKNSTDTQSKNDTKTESIATITKTETSKPPSQPTQRQLEKQQEKEERQKQRELEKQERDKKKEEERLRKEHDRKAKEDERKRKLAEREAEKESRRLKLEKEKHEREMKKEEEKRRKDEREQQRLEKKRQLEEEKQQREEERLKAELDKKKAEEAKERSQMKISSFFQVRNHQKPTSKALDADTTTESTNSSEIANPPSKSTYETVFLPFFCKQNVVLAASPQLSSTELDQTVKDFDAVIDSIKSGSQATNQLSLQDFFSQTRQQSRLDQPKSTVSPEDVVTALNTTEEPDNDRRIGEMLNKFPPIKYLQFYENQKPPYIGSWCSKRHTSANFPILNPFDTSSGNVDYEYDSDLDDEDADGEGEDLDSNDEEDDEEATLDDDGEMDDFVESNDLTKRKFMGPLIPISTWNDNDEKADSFFDDMKFERLDFNIRFPIDPLHDYWNENSSKKDIHYNTEPSSTGNRSVVHDKPTGTDSKSNTNVVSESKGTVQAPNIITPQKRTIQDPTAIFELIQFIEKNNDFTIGTMVELAKKEFKVFTKAVLKHTIQDIATYNKKSSIWSVKEEIKSQLSKRADGTGSGIAQSKEGVSA